MALISFPINPDSIRNKLFYVGPQVSSGSTIKSEVGYVVPSNRNSFITINFNGIYTQQDNSSKTIESAVTRSFSLNDFIKSGDVVYAGYIITFGGSGALTFQWFYNLNGSPVHTDTYSFSATSSSRDPSVNTTIQILELDK